MSDYRIEAKIRNARFLRALEGIGETPTGFASKRGLNVTRMCGIASMKAKPVNAAGDWWPEVMALCDAANVMPCELFTPRQMEGLERTTSKQEVTEAEIAGQLASMEAALLETRSPERRAMDSEIATRLFASLQETHPRHAKAVAAHQEGALFEEIAKDINVSRARAHQIVLKGYRIMRERARKRMGVTSYDAMEVEQ